MLIYTHPKLKQAADSMGILSRRRHTTRASWARSQHILLSCRIEIKPRREQSSLKNCTEENNVMMIVNCKCLLQLLENSKHSFNSFKLFFIQTSISCNSNSWAINSFKITVSTNHDVDVSMVSYIRQQIISFYCKRISKKCIISNDICTYIQHNIEDTLHPCIVCVKSFEWKCIVFYLKPKKHLNITIGDVI